jgi:hypothetical protein
MWNGEKHEDGEMNLVRALGCSVWSGIGLLICAGVILAQSPAQTDLTGPARSAETRPTQVGLAATAPAQTAPTQSQPTIQSQLAQPRLDLAAIDAVDECLVPQICVDRYLWLLYDRTPKLDSLKLTDKKKVVVKRKGKPKIVTITTIRIVDEDFTWKDPKAADRVHMALADYVIGGMDRSFKLTLYRALRMLDNEGFQPGITSAFRDDYRQEIASGLKARTDRSYHGGSFRGGYGNGLAADIVSVKGESRSARWVASDIMWKWIDAHEKELGIGRPYRDVDAPHVGSIDGKEYIDHRVAPKLHVAKVAHSAAKKAAQKAQVAKSAAKKHHQATQSGDHDAAKRTSTTKSAKVKSS